MKTTLNLIQGILLLGFCIKVSMAHWDGAYMRYRYNFDGYAWPTNWLSQIPDEQKITNIAFPGSENSGAFDADQRPYNPFPSTDFDEALRFLSTLGVANIISDTLTTQALNFKDQLNHGIRAFDIQVYHVNDLLVLTSGLSHLSMTFYTVLDAVKSFLTGNPTETILINIYQSKRIVPIGGLNNQHSIEYALASYLDADNLRSYHFNPSNLDVTLGEARGKFIIICQEETFSSQNTWKLDHSNSVIMDQQYLGSNWDLYWGKWIPVKEHLYSTVNSFDERPHIVFINGFGGSFPYFVASGHSSPQTNAPRLSTGYLNIFGPNTYPDFPRVLGSIMFEGVNILTRDFIRNIHSEKRTVGIIFADFPGQDLINTIIQNNKRLMKNKNERPMKSSAVTNSSLVKHNML